MPLDPVEGAKLVRHRMSICRVQATESVVPKDGREIVLAPTFASQRLLRGPAPRKPVAGCVVWSFIVNYPSSGRVRHWPALVVDEPPGHPRSSS